MSPPDPASPMGPIDIRYDPAFTAAYLVKAGPATTAAEVEASLRAAGVVEGVDQAAIALALGELPRGAAPQRIACGQPARKGQDARLEFARPPSRMAASGDVVATFTPATAGREGRDLKGRPLPASPGHPGEPQAGDGIARSETGRVFRATAAGVVHRSASGIISVKPVVRIAENDLTACVSLPAAAEGQNAMTAKDVAAALARQGVRHGLDTRRLAAAVARAAKGQPVFDEPIAQGQAPGPGRDGQLHVLFPVELSAGPRRPDGSIDFDAQGYAVGPVEIDARLIEALPPKPGEPGLGVSGREIPALPGRTVKVEPGEGAIVSFGGTLYQAQADGYALLSGGLLRVLDLKVIQGDVFAKTGNPAIKDRGLLVSGNVQDGMQAQASGPIIVYGNIGDARIKAGEALHVGGTIMGGKEGRCEARGRLECGSARGARLHAGGVIRIHGSIGGGEATALGRLEILGSAGIPEVGPSLLRAGATAAGLQALSLERLRLEEQMRNIKATKREQELRQERREELEHDIAQIKAGLAAPPEEAPMVIVHGTVHPGVEVAIRDAVFKAQEPLESVAFRYEGGNPGRIRPEPLAAT